MPEKKAKKPVRQRMRDWNAKRKLIRSAKELFRERRQYPEKYNVKWFQHGVQKLVKAGHPHIAIKLVERELAYQKRLLQKCKVSLKDLGKGGPIECPMPHGKYRVYYKDDLPMLRRFKESQRIHGKTRSAGESIKKLEQLQEELNK